MNNNSINPIIKFDQNPVSLTDTTPRAHTVDLIEEERGEIIIKEKILYERREREKYIYTKEERNLKITKNIRKRREI